MANEIISDGSSIPGQRDYGQRCPETEHVDCCRFLSQLALPTKFRFSESDTRVDNLFVGDSVQFEFLLGDLTIQANGPSAFACLDPAQRQDLFKSCNVVFNELVKVSTEFPHMGSEIETLARLFLIQAEVGLRRNFGNGSSRTPSELFKRVEKRLTRKVRECIALADTIDREGEVLDLACGGTAVMGLLATARGQTARGIEIGHRSASLAQRIASILGRDLRVQQGDIRDLSYSDTPHWVSKHPCAKGRALPDEILAQWVDDPTACSLSLMPCCPGNARVSLPLHYSTHLGVTEERWDQLNALASIASDTRSKRWSEGKAAFAELNEIRVNYLQHLGIDVRVVVVKDTHFGDIICASK